MKKSFQRSVVTFLIISGSALLFCSKGVFIKSAFGEGVGVVSLLLWRMLFALPFFLVAGWVTERRADRKMNRRIFCKLILLGFIGYYFSSLVNFLGLQYISVGLERMVLYTYPTLVLIGSAVFCGKKIKAGMVVAVVVTYAGLFVGALQEIDAPGSGGSTGLGVGLVFLSAMSYATFMLLSGSMIRELGNIRFTSYVLSIAAILMVIHATLTGVELSGSREVWKYGMILAIFGTVLPAFLLGMGLERAGAQKFAIISTVGPVGTLILAGVVLGETISLGSVIGFILTMAGGLSVSLMKDS